MYACPNCNEATITAKEKYKAKRASPVCCSKCHKLSSVSGNIEGVILIFHQALFYIGLLIAFKYWSYIPLLIAVFIGVLAEYLVFKFAPLRVVSEKEVKKLNYLYSIGLFMFVLVILLSFKNV